MSADIHIHRKYTTRLIRLNLRAPAWAGGTLASMQVYDLLRCIEFCRTLPGVDAGIIGIAARTHLHIRYG